MSLNGVQVIAVTSGKGGVGKTNTSINIAASLAKQGHKVMLMDADLGYPSAQQLVAHAVAAELAEEDGGAIDALARLLHATPGKPSGLSDRSLLNTRPVASPKFGSLKDTPLAAMGLASYRSH